MKNKLKLLFVLLLLPFGVFAPSHSVSAANDFSDKLQGEDGIRKFQV